jgi:hypothetical protein
LCGAAAEQAEQLMPWEPSLMKPRHRSLFTLLAMSLGVGGVGWFCCAGMSLHFQNDWGWLDTLLFSALSIAIFAGCTFVWFAANYEDPPAEPPSAVAEGDTQDSL